MRLYAVALSAALGMIAYFIAFLAFGVKQEERRFYLSKLRELARKREPGP